MLHCTALFSQELQSSVLHAQRHGSSPTPQRLHSPPHAVVKRHVFTPSSLKPQPLPGIKRVVPFGWKGLLHMTEEWNIQKPSLCDFREGSAALPAAGLPAALTPHRAFARRCSWSLHPSVLEHPPHWFRCFLQATARPGERGEQRGFSYDYSHPLFSEAGSFSLNLQLHTWRATAVEV